MSHHKKTVFRQLTSSAFFILIFLILSAELFAQTEPLVAELSFNNFVAVFDGNNDSTLKRPRIVGEAKVLKFETAKLEENAGSTSAMLLATQLERQAFAVLNQKRAEKGLHPLTWSDDMAKVARSHSQEMAQFKFFSHAGRNGSMVDDRADRFGFSKWKAIGENIAYNRGYENPAQFACERWMQSNSHRENILSARWKEAGIGVAAAPDGTYYFTEVFLAR